MNYPEFKAAVARNEISNRELSIKLGISEQTLYNKLNGVAEFKNSEIKNLASILSLSMADVNLIFFDSTVN